MKHFIGALFLFSTMTVVAQYPATDIYVMDMARVGEDYFKFVNPIYLNSDNAGAYNNQPYFIDDSKLLVTSQRDGKQTDIYVYNFNDFKVTKLTNTPNQSEFSPMKIPNENEFSTINIEKDQKTQRLWKYPFGAPMTGNVMVNSVKNVGYYEWMDENRAAVYIVDEPSRLEVLNVKDETTVRYATNIGRCFKKMSNGDLCFIQKTDEQWFLKRLDVNNLDVVTIAPTLVESEDFAILPDDTILMGKGDKLYKLHADRDKQWSMVGDFKSFEIKNITRIAVSDNKIAIVASKR